MTNAAPLRPEDTRFCSEHSLAVGEPLAGWGAHAARNVLIRWPKGRWRHSLRLAGGMDPALEAAIERVVAAGWRVNLIDRKGDEDSEARVFVFPQAVALDVPPDDLPGFLDALARDGFVPGSLPTRPVETPLILCCTHGRHDACCAKWGFAAYKALAAEAGRRGDFDVWEVTHLGGCRLSAGVLVLPALRKYGRLRPADAAPLLAAEAQGRPYLPRYRGAAHLDPPAQVAEVAGLQHLAEIGLHGTAGVTKEAPNRYAVRVSGGTALMQTVPEEVRSYGACADLKAAEPLESKTVWRARLLSLTSTQTEWKHS